MSRLVDPTAIELNTDPLTRTLSGITNQGGHEFCAPYMTEIADNLWNGGCADGLILPDRIDHLISLYKWEQYTVEHNLLSALTVEMYDSRSHPVDTEQILALARWANVCRKSGEVLIHCQAGLNRSGMITAATLMLDGMTADEAIKALREKRSPASLCNTRFVEVLQGLEYKIHGE